MSLPTNRKPIQEAICQILADGKEHKWNDIFAALVEHFSLTDKELDVRLRNGRPKFTQFCYLARAQLKIEGLIHSPKKDYWKLS